MGSKRIVISGLGTLCPLGLNTKQAWTRLIGTHFLNKIEFGF